MRACDEGEVIPDRWSFIAHNFQALTFFLILWESEQVSFIGMRSRYLIHRDRRLVQDLQARSPKSRGWRSHDKEKKLLHNLIIARRLVVPLSAHDISVTTGSDPASWEKDHARTSRRPALSACSGLVRTCRLIFGSVGDAFGS